MKALILAAGLGSRLSPLTDNIPKALVPVNGKPIIMKQIENLHLNGITDITIIAGYLSDVLIKSVHEQYPNICIINSPDYAITNNMYSAYLGRQSVRGDAFLMMNADVYYDASVITALLQFKNSNAIVVDVGRYIEESMKVVERNGKLVQISKQVESEIALGSSIDVYKFSDEGGKLFFNRCAEYISKGELNLWSEVALNDILKCCDFKGCPLVGRWFEIDNHEDLRDAELLFKE